MVLVGFPGLMGNKSELNSNDNESRWSWWLLGGMLGDPAALHWRMTLDKGLLPVPKLSATFSMALR